MKQTTDCPHRWVISAVVFVLLIWATLVGGIAYVAIHFIIKFW